MKLFRRSSRRTEVCPPEANTFGTYESRWRYLTRWLWPDADAEAKEVKKAFEDALRGLPGDAAEKMRARVRSAPGMRELWHLRSAVFGLLAQQSCQSVAQRRMEAVDRFFTTRRQTSAPATPRRS